MKKFSFSKYLNEEYSEYGKLPVYGNGLDFFLGGTSNPITVKNHDIDFGDKNYQKQKEYIDSYFKWARNQSDWSDGSDNPYSLMFTSGVRHGHGTSKHNEHVKGVSALDIRYNPHFYRYSETEDAIAFRKANNLSLLSPDHKGAPHIHLGWAETPKSDWQRDIGWGLQDKGILEWTKFKQEGDLGRKYTQIYNSYQNLDTNIPVIETKSNTHNTKNTRTMAVKTTPYNTLRPNFSEDGVKFDNPFDFQDSFEVGLKLDNQNPQMTLDYIQQAKLDEAKKKQLELNQQRHNLEMLSRMGSYDYGVGDYAYKVGESIGFDVDKIHPDLGEKDKKGIRNANIWRGIFAGLGGTLGLAKNIFGGIAQSKHNSLRAQEYAEKQRLSDLYGDYKYVAEDGGKYTKFARSIYPEVRRQLKERGLPVGSAEHVVLQLANESSYGEKPTGKNNFAGIKYFDSMKGNPKITGKTLNKRDDTYYADFDSPATQISFYLDNLLDKWGTAPFEQDNPGDFVRKLFEGEFKYATEKGLTHEEKREKYANKVSNMSTMKKYLELVKDEIIEQEGREMLKKGEVHPPEIPEGYYKYGMDKGGDEPSLLDVKVNYFEQGGAFSNISNAEAFTGDFIPQDSVAPNAEVEGGEYTQRPNGEVKEVKGSKHKHGGVDVHLEEDEKVLSDKRKIGKGLAEEFRSTFDVRIYARDTYAEALAKVEKKLGIKKLQKELESIYKEIEKNEEIDDSTTVEQNLTFLSKKIENIEQQKLPLEQIKSVVFDILWRKQEGGKGNNVSKEPVPIVGMEPQPSPEQIQEIQKRQGEHKGDNAENYFKDGGKLGEIGWRDNTYDLGSPDEFGHQSKNNETWTYGDTKGTINQRLLQYINMFPELSKEFFVTDSEGNIKMAEGKEVKDFQNAYNERLEREKKTLISKNPDSKEYIENMYDNHRFLSDDTDKDNVRYTDNKMGEYTSSRGFYTKNVVYPETVKLLQKEGIMNLQQLKGVSSEDMANKYKMTSEQIDYINENIGEDEVYLIGAYENKGDEIEGVDVPKPKDVKVEMEEDMKTPTSTTNPDDDKKLPEYQRQQAGRKGGALLFPSQGRMMPRALELPSLFQVKYDRVDRFKTDVNPLLIESARTMRAGEEMLNNTNDSVNKVLAGQMAMQNMEQVGEALGRVSEIDFQNAMQTDRLNSNLEIQEDNANLNQKLSYEDRAFRAEAATDLDLDNYFESLRQDRLQRNRMQHQAYTISDSMENFNINSMGEVEFDPTTSKVLTDPKGDKYVKHKGVYIKLDNLKKMHQEKLDAIEKATSVKKR